MMILQYYNLLGTLGDFISTYHTLLLYYPYSLSINSKIINALINYKLKCASIKLFQSLASPNNNNNETIYTRSNWLIKQIKQVSFLLVIQQSQEQIYTRVDRVDAEETLRKRPEKSATGLFVREAREMMIVRLKYWRLSTDHNSMCWSWECVMGFPVATLLSHRWCTELQSRRRREINCSPLLYCLSDLQCKLQRPSEVSCIGRGCGVRCGGAKAIIYDLYELVGENACAECSSELCFMR